MNFKFTSSNNLLFLIATIAVLNSCTTTGPSGVFGKKSPHEVYGDRIKEAGLEQTAMGRQWFQAAEQSLLNPLIVNLPYSETGYFPAEKPKAVGVRFRARRGEKITINLNKKPATGFALYLDLWEPSVTNNTSKPKLLISADTTAASLTYNVKQEGNYVVRIQPELLKGGEYTLSIINGPSLAFPIAPGVKSNVGSFWGQGRDNGSRRHEGIDIFAPKRSPLVAAANGVVTRVEEYGLGGKVIFLHPDNEDYSLYYAHLDQHLVERGRRVKTGDTIGLVGNTGNAQHTAPHLHFGIYTNRGAVDPFPFVNRVSKSPEKITAPLQNIDKWVRNNKAAKISFELSNSSNGFTIEQNTLLKVEAATAGWYKVSLPDGSKGYITSGIVSPASSPIRKVNIKTTQPLLDEPNTIASRKTTLAAGESVNIIAGYKDFYFVNKDNNEEGWLPKNAL
jgi:murein DD-endopeptidase MepM/ murein hydrolase activator NlpD